MHVGDDYEVSVSTWGGEFRSRPIVDRVVFARNGSAISFRCFRDRVQVGGGGHGCEAAQQVEALLERLALIPAAPHPDSASIADGLHVDLVIDYGDCQGSFRWYHECPPAWTAAGRLVDLLRDWGRPHLPPV